MKYAIGILNWIKTNKILAFVLIATITFSATQIFKAKGKANCEDCKPYKEMTSQLLDALKKAPTSYEPMQTSYQYAVYFEGDTTKPMTQTQWNRYKDSLVIATQKKIDSLKKTKNK